MEEKKMGANAQKIGGHIMKRLREMQINYPAIGDVRGLGLMIGVEIIEPDGSTSPGIRDRIVMEGFREGIVLLSCGDSTIRFSPPLVITKEETDLGMDRFEEALKKAI